MPRESRSRAARAFAVSTARASAAARADPTAGVLEVAADDAAGLVVDPGPPAEAPLPACRAVAPDGVAAALPVAGAAAAAAVPDVLEEVGPAELVVDSLDGVT